MDVSDHKRLSNTTLETQVKHWSSLHFSVTEWSSRLYLHIYWKKQFILFLTSQKLKLEITIIFIIHSCLQNLVIM